MRISGLVFVLLILSSWLISPAGAIQPPSQTELEEALTCQCGCGLTVHSCNHLQCGFAVPRKKEIAQSLDAGKGREEILASFVSTYGEKILSAPTKTGFNLAAWLMPFVVVVAGGVLIGIVSLRWSKRESQEDTPESAPSVVTDQQRRRLQKELDSFET